MCYICNPFENKMKADMKTFRSIVPLAIPELRVSHHDKMMTLGSCFSENIGEKLIYHGFDSVSNPLGVLFNPASICKTLNRLIDSQFLSENDFFQHGSLWNSFSCSSVMSNIKLNESLINANKQIESASTHLQQTKVLMITWGTSWIYEHKKSGEVVANCHKLPSSEFVRRRLSVDEIVSDYLQLFERLGKLSSINIILTISPIRHWKDGAHENTLSKAILHLAADELEKRYKNVFYFPAYELMIDELRDYRFYADDFFHPSALAVDYIWERFGDVCFNTETKELANKIAEYRKMKEHRPLHGNTTEYQEFMKKTEEKRNVLLFYFPFLKGRI